MKPISIRFTEEELKEIQEKAKQANMSRSDYIRYHVLSGDSVQVVDKGKEFYQSLIRINEAVSKVESLGKKPNCNIIRKEVLSACRLLN